MILSLNAVFLSLLRVTHFTQFEKGILCPKSLIYRMEVFSWYFVTVKPGIQLIVCFFCVFFFFFVANYIFQRFIKSQLVFFFFFSTRVRVRVTHFTHSPLQFLKLNLYRKSFFNLSYLRFLFFLFFFFSFIKPCYQTIEIV